MTRRRSTAPVHASPVHSCASRRSRASSSAKSCAPPPPSPSPARGSDRLYREVYADLLACAIHCKPGRCVRQARSRWLPAWLSGSVCVPASLQQGMARERFRVGFARFLARRLEGLRARAADRARLTKLEREELAMLEQVDDALRVVSEAAQREANSARALAAQKTALLDLMTELAGSTSPRAQAEHRNAERELAALERREREIEDRARNSWSRTLMNLASTGTVFSGAAVVIAYMLPGILQSSEAPLAKVVEGVEAYKGVKQWETAANTMGAVKEGIAAVSGAGAVKGATSGVVDTVKGWIWG